MANPRLSVSTWSLHGSLGGPGIYGPEAGNRVPDDFSDGEALPLLELPARLREFGIGTLEICHFRLPSRDPSYLNELREALKENRIELFSLLVDGGDITDPKNAARDLDWIAGWFEVARTLAAHCVRVIAGKSKPDKESLRKSRQGLQALSALASKHHLRLMTENWFELLSSPEPVLQLLGELEGAVGLCMDFGNWSGETKYEDLAAIAPLAESCHARADFVGSSEPQLDESDFQRCLNITREVEFSGPYTLIPTGWREDEWEALRVVRDVTLAYMEP